MIDITVSLAKSTLVKFRVLFNSTLLPDFIYVFAEQREQVSFSMARGNVEFMQECFPKTLAYGNSKNLIRHKNK